MTPAMALTGLLVAGAVLAALRLLIGTARMPASSRPRAWRVAVLLVGTVLSSWLLWRLLLHANADVPVQTIHIATEGVGLRELPAPARGIAVLRLPEAPSALPVPRVPDLASARRLHPQAHQLVVHGHGLTARDRPAAAGLATALQAAALPPGIRGVWWTRTLPSGGVLRVHGEVERLPGAHIALLDVAGAVIDQQTLQEDGVFDLQARVRGNGPLAYSLRLRGADRRDIETLPVDLQVRDTLPARIVLRAGGPDPEAKFLGRWAADRGARWSATIALGAGMQTGDAPLPLDAATLDGIDLLILDDRSWAALGAAQRNAVLAAVSRGMGLLLRSGVAVTGLPGIALRAAAAQPVKPAIAGVDAAKLPTLQRPAVLIDAPSGVAVWRDDRGRPLASYVAHGRGRIGAWLLHDSFQLQLAGRSELHAQLWGAMLDRLLRARAPAPAQLPALAWPGERLALCGLQADMAIETPQGTRVPLLLDPATGPRRCAAFWPAQAGWHRLDGASQALALRVLEPAQARTLRLAAMQAQTRALTTRQIAAPSLQGRVSDRWSRLGAWPLFAAWLALVAALWWFERSRYGRGRPLTPG